MKKRRVIDLLTLIIVAFAMFGVSYVYATGYKTVQYWESDAYDVGYWSSSPKIYVTSLSSGSYVASDVTNARNQWNNAGISSSITTSLTQANLFYYGGTKSELNLTGYFNYTSIDVGMTYYDGSSLVDTVYYNTTGMNVYSYSLVYASTSNEATYHLNVTLHELGHALGWRGHCQTYYNSVMYYQTNNISTLTVYDKRHLKQVYDVMN